MVVNPHADGSQNVPLCKGYVLVDGGQPTRGRLKKRSVMHGWWDKTCMEATRSDTHKNRLLFVKVAGEVSRTYVSRRTTRTRSKVSHPHRMHQQKNERLKHWKKKNTLVPFLTRYWGLLPAAACFSAILATAISRTSPWQHTKTHTHTSTSDARKSRRTRGEKQGKSGQATE